MIWLWRIWSLIYFALLFYIVFLARRRPSPHFGYPRIEPNLVPFKHKWHILTHYAAVAGDGFYMDIMGNVVMFIPLSIFLYVVYGMRSLWKIALFGFLTSTSIELIQYLTSIGQPDIDDVCLNTLGALLGVLVIDGVVRTTRAVL